MSLEIRSPRVNGLISLVLAILGYVLFLWLGYELGLFWGFGQEYSVFSHVLTIILFFISLFFLTDKRKAIFIALVPVFFLIIYLLPAQPEPHEVVNDLGAFADGKPYKFSLTDSDRYSLSLSMTSAQLSDLSGILSTQMQERLFVQSELSSNEGIIKQITSVVLDGPVGRPLEAYPAIVFLFEAPLDKGIEYTIKVDLGFLPAGTSVPSYQMPPRLKGLQPAEMYTPPVDSEKPAADHILTIPDLPSETVPKIVTVNYNWPLGSLIRLKLPYLFLETGGFLVLAGLVYILFALALMSLTAVSIKHFRVRRV